MTKIMQRPVPIFAPEKGLLCNDHFQVSYATNDIDRALGVFGDRFGIKNFQHIEGDLPSGGHIRVALAWVGGTIYELITGSGPGTEFYTQRLPADTFSIQHHHLGYLVYGDEGWQALEKVIADGGWKIVHKNDNGEFMKSCYIEVPELGHYLEYMCPSPTGLAFFEGVPNN